jgi:hypothetical protein
VIIQLDVQAGSGDPDTPCNHENGATSRATWYESVQSMFSDPTVRGGEAMTEPRRQARATRASIANDARGDSVSLDDDRAQRATGTAIRNTRAASADSERHECR